MFHLETTKNRRLDMNDNTTLVSSQVTMDAAGRLARGKGEGDIILIRLSYVSSAE